MKRVGILRGGAGEHYAKSLKRGADVIIHILENLGEKYKPVDILIDKDYVWHLGGVPIVPSDLSSKIDVVWNVSHPNLSNILESLSIPHIGVSNFYHTLESSKDMLREHMKKIGVNMPRHILLPVYQEDFDGLREKYAIKAAKAVFEKFGSPWVVKSFTPEENMGVHLAKTFNELVAAIEDGVKHEKSILVEEFITGTVASIHSVAGFRGEDLYTFPPINVFGSISPGEKEKLISLAKDLHEHIGAKHYSKFNFVLPSRGGVYLLHIDGAPNLRANSHFSEVCESVGTKMHHVVEHMLEEALR